MTADEIPPPPLGATPLPTTLCPACARPATLLSFSTKQYVPRLERAAFEALYSCDAGHEIRVYVREAAP